jgi:hypothetical protein
LCLLTFNITGNEVARIHALSQKLSGVSFDSVLIVINGRKRHAVIAATNRIGFVINADMVSIPVHSYLSI